MGLADGTAWEKEHGYDELLTSEEWSKHDDFKKYVILDPDGWRDEKNPCDFHKDKITREQFNQRLMRCTLIWK